MSLTQTQLEDAAKLLCSAHDNHQQLPMAALANCTPQTIEDAYAIQDAVAQKRWISQGGRTTAWKTGAASAAATPYIAPIPPQQVYTGPASLPAKDHHMIGVEAELAYRFAEDLPPRDKPYSPEEVMAAIEGVYVAIEVVDTRLAEWQKAGDWWRLADNQITAGLVIGSGRTDWQDLDPLQQNVELLFDGVTEVSRKGTHPIGDPRPLLPWVANHCTGRSGGLKAGDVIITGSWTGLIFIKPGLEVTARFPGVGEAVVSFPV